MATIKDELRLLRELLCFKETGKTGKINETAGKHGYKQSNFSNMLKQLEEELNLPLLTRLSTGVVLTSDGREIFEIASQIENIFVGPFSVVGAAAQFANPNNYANFQAGASTGGKSENGATVAVSGAVNLNYITNNANVIVGKNTEISGIGKVDINASAVQEDVAFNGKLGLTGGADNAAGGTVGVHFGEVNSMVAIAEGAEVTGSAINIGADNDVAHTAITFGAGKAEGNALAGMGSYLEGDSNSIAAAPRQYRTGMTQPDIDLARERWYNFPVSIYMTHRAAARTASICRAGIT